MTTLPQDARAMWSHRLMTVGFIAMLVGAIDPMEGSLAILPGSGLVAWGLFLGHGDRRLVIYRAWMFALIAVGVAALWGFSQVGGLGGTTGLSMWWGLMVVPYLIGLSASIWGPGSPRWTMMAGIAIGLWYLVIPAMVWLRSGRPQGDMGFAPIVVIGALGLVTLGGCIVRLTRRSDAPAGR